MSRSEWSKPLLTVVSRGQAEERVLDSCKTADDYVGLGPEDGYSTCYRAGYCYDPGCQTLVAS